jgi:hypothetical protein
VSVALAEYKRQFPQPRIPEQSIGMRNPAK